MVKKAVAIFLLLLWLGIIFGFSNADGQSSWKMSDLLIKRVVFIFSDIEDGTDAMQSIIDKYSFLVRKIAHFTEYFILGIIVFYVFLSFNVDKKVLIYTSVFCIFAAIVDEWHQTFIDGRNGSFLDVLLDSSGSMIGVYIISNIYIYRLKLKKVKAKTF